MCEVLGKLSDIVKLLLDNVGVVEPKTKNMN